MTKGNDPVIDDAMRKLEYTIETFPYDLIEITFSVDHGLRCGDTIPNIKNPVEYVPTPKTIWIRGPLKYVD